MKRLLFAIWAMLSSRALTPLVIGFFLLLYIGIAFFTDDTLTALMEFTRRSIALSLLLALLPLNSLGRLVTETGRFIRRRRAMAGDAAQVPSELFDETVSLPVSSSLDESLPDPAAPPTFAGLEERLGAVGYRTRRTGKALTAWRGVNIFPVRGLYLMGVFCVFAGILISLTTRKSFRGTVIEGEPLPPQAGGRGIVERITLGRSSGLVLAKDLTMEVTTLAPGEERSIFGVYPPSLYRGAFVYPRYLGIGLVIGFSAPDGPSGYETHAVMAIYPPGKEAAVEIPGSAYRIVFSLAQPNDGTDPYMTGRMTFLFKLLKGKEVLFSGSAPSGGEFVRDGYRLAIPDSRRLVMTDFIRDYGVLMIWAAGILFIVAWSIWLPIRILFPRREMMFRAAPDGIRACSFAEGKERRHVGVFHESLDFLEAKGSATRPING